MICPVELARCGPIGRAALLANRERRFFLYSTRFWSPNINILVNLGSSIEIDSARFTHDLLLRRLFSRVWLGGFPFPSHIASSWQKVVSGIVQANA